MTATTTSPVEEPTSPQAAPPIDRALLTVAVVVVLGTIMSILDTTVVNVAINTLAARFHTTLPTIQWVATGYTLALATVIPLTGWIADRFGTKRLYMVSIALFICGSSLSGLAWSSDSIIVFRVLQVMSIIGVPMLIGPILGPILGGWLVADVSWRWIFFINLPIGIVALVCAARILPRDVAAHEQRLDLVDLVLLSPGLALVIYGLAESDSAGGFGSLKVLLPLFAGIALLGGFVWHALRARAPLIDLRLFRNRSFATSSGTLVLIAISVFGSFLLLPLYFQAVRGESAFQSGLLLAPQGFGSMLAMPVAGQLADRTGAGRIVPFGLIAVAAAVLGLTQVGARTSFWLISVDLFVFGIGMGFAMMPTFTGAMQSLRNEAVARASTALNILQQAGASVGTAVLSVLLASALSSRLGGGHGTLGSTAAIPSSVRAHLAAPMAAAFGQTFWWAFGLLVVAFIGSLTMPRRRPEVFEGAPA
jgi:MFS family permease